MKFYFLAMILFRISSISTAQIKGIVLRQDSTKNTPIENAKIRLSHSKQGVFSNKEGRFDFVLPKQLPDTLVISAMGYLSDSIIVLKMIDLSRLLF